MSCSYRARGGSVVGHYSTGVLVLTGAVHKVLFREGHQFSSGVEVLSLQRACGAEGPAGATLTLEEGGRVLEARKQENKTLSKKTHKFCLSLITEIPFH